MLTECGVIENEKGVGFLLSTDPAKINTGKNVIEAGLWLQIISFGFFIANALLFWVRIGRGAGWSSAFGAPWVRHMVALLLASTLILVRCIYRVIEYLQGAGGQMQTHEAYMYALDSGPMLVVMSILAVVHPSEIGSLLYGKRMVTKLFWVRDAAPDPEADDGRLELDHRPFSASR
jgi:hypothetical protein